MSLGLEKLNHVFTLGDFSIHFQQLSITYPQVSQSYRCIETFETKDTKNKTFKVAKKEIVEVLLKDMTGRFH